MGYVINNTLERLKESYARGSRNILTATTQKPIDLTSHPVTFDLVKMYKEDSKTRRKVKEAIEIYKDGQALNRDHGRKIPPILLQLVSRDLPGHME